MSQQTNAWCGRCGVDLPDPSVAACPECGAGRPAVSGQGAAHDKEAAKTIEPAPGSMANGALRLFGILDLLGSIVLAIWSFSEMGTMEVSSGFGSSTQTVANPVANAIAVAVLLQGVLVAALFFAIAAIGDNLIAIRANTAHRSRGGGAK